MVCTSSRILSCGVWLMLMRNTSAPASNSFRIIALSDDAGPSVARILIRRSRLIAWAPRLAAADPVCPGREPRPDRLVLPCPEFPARAAPAARWLRSIARSMLAVRRCRPRKSQCGVTARQAILGALDSEFLVARTHE